MWGVRRKSRGDGEPISAFFNPTSTTTVNFKGHGINMALRFGNGLFFKFYLQRKRCWKKLKQRP
jgi:hypothetical protein